MKKKPTNFDRMVERALRDPEVRAGYEAEKRRGEKRAKAAKSKSSVKK